MGRHPVVPADAVHEGASVRVQVFGMIVERRSHIVLMPPARLSVNG
jgi:hypothetical protein